jgi:hypothetical protein
LNGKIIDPYRNFRNFNGLYVDRLQSCKDKAYFDKYNAILENYLNKKDHALFSIEKFEIFNPFNYYTYPSGQYYDIENARDWDKADFIKFDIVKLFNGYNYMVLLPGWWKCKEARLKRNIAKCLAIKIITLKKLIKELS